MGIDTNFPHGLCQEPDRRGNDVADQRNRLHQRPRLPITKPSPRWPRRSPTPAFRFSPPPAPTPPYAAMASPPRAIPKLTEGRPNIIDHIKNGKVQLIINTPTKKGPATDEGKIRA